MPRPRPTEACVSLQRSTGDPSMSSGQPTGSFNVVAASNRRPRAVMAANGMHLCRQGHPTGGFRVARATNGMFPAINAANRALPAYVSARARVLKRGRHPVPFRDMRRWPGAGSARVLGW